MHNSPDAIIVGAGVIGSAIAFEMAKKGYQTLNIDKAPTAGFGSTSNSCALVRAHYSTFEGTAFAYDNFWYWQNWEEYLGVKDELGYAKYHQTGTMWLPSPLHGYKHILKLYDQVGVPYEIWDRPRIEARVPILDTHSNWPIRRPESADFWDKENGKLDFAIYTPESGYVSDPQLASHNLMRAAEAHGAQFMFNSEITAVRKANNRVIGVTLSDGTQIDSPIVINVAGPHSFVINQMAGVIDDMNVKTRALRHEVHHIPSPAAMDYEKDGLHCSDGDSAIYFRPEVGRAIMVGSEDPACDTQEWIENPDNFNRSVTYDQWKAQVYRLAKRLPDLPIPDTPKGVVDLYDVSTDWIPIYDRSSLSGFYMAIGTSGNQFKNAAGAGDMMTQIITACENGSNHDTDPVQYACRNLAINFSAGFFSRNRPVNADSSFSVLG